MDVAPEIAEAIDCAITAGACRRAHRITGLVGWLRLAEWERAEACALVTAFAAARDIEHHSVTRPVRPAERSRWAKSRFRPRAPGPKG